MVSKALDIGSWACQAEHPDITTLTLRSSRGPIDIINVYNPKPVTPRSRTPSRLPEVKKAIRDSVEGEREIILLGDFNLHHPRWGGIHCAADDLAGDLLAEAEQQGLALALPPGSVTWRRGGRASTIDLTFVSAELSQRIAECQPREDWAQTADHIPILLKVETGCSRAEPRARFAISKMDASRFRQAVRLKLENRQELWPERRETAVQPNQEAIDAAVHEVQKAILGALQEHCPRSKPTKHARHAWSDTCSNLVRLHRAARRRYVTSQEPTDEAQYKALRNQLKNQLRKESRHSWRGFIEETTASVERGHNAGLWRLSRWARRKAGRPRELPHLPPLRRNDRSPHTGDNKEKARILAERFFPPPENTDLSDTTGEANQGAPTERICVEASATAAMVQEAIRHLPSKKTPGPDGITNEVLKLCSSEIASHLADIARACFKVGYHPKEFRNTITVVLRKEGKPDYSLPGSYRPIALENTLGKVIERLVADRLSTAIEEHALVPNSQMGARRDRSAVSALSQLVDVVHTAWARNPKFIVSMLSLDLTGAFDRVSHDRLLWILRKKRLPEWIVKFVQAFLVDRKTQLTFSGFTSDVIMTQTGIPQGSPLSPVLFLLFANELLGMFDSNASNVIGLGFVDDTNLLVWGPTAAGNCRQLEDAHQRCLTWARRHGGKFAPDKYKLIHFTRRRDADIQAAAQIEGFDGKPVDALRVLGVWVDRKLKWASHVQEAVRKGAAQFEALSRVTSSTWGPSFNRSRLLYAAVVRPTITYGCKVWAGGERGKPPPARLLQPLVKLQNQCLRKITGAYRRAPTKALEKEAAVEPLPLYVRSIAMQQALGSETKPVTSFIKRTCDRLWSRHQPRRGRRPPRPPTPMEDLLSQAKAAEREATVAYEMERRNRRRGRRQTEERLDRDLMNAKRLMLTWRETEWRRQWLLAAEGKQTPAWQTPWKARVPRLHGSLSKPESTMATLLRTEAIGLNDFLHRVGVPGVEARCSCGWERQTPKHVVMFCPSLTGRDQMLAAAGTMDYTTLLATERGLRAVTTWLIRQNILPQFRTARAMAAEDRSGWRPLQPLGWEELAGDE